MRRIVGCVRRSQWKPPAFKPFHHQFYSTATTSPPAALEVPSEIIIDDFAKVNMVIGTIQQVEHIPKSQKLFKITVDLGNNETRVILSGVRKFYPTQEDVENLLINKQCIVVENLKPRSMAGVMSHGMILFTTGKDTAGNDSICLVNPNNTANGSTSSCIVDNGTRVM